MRSRVMAACSSLFDPISGSLDPDGCAQRLTAAADGHSDPAHALIALVVVDRPTACGAVGEFRQQLSAVGDGVLGETVQLPERVDTLHEVVAGAGEDRFADGRDMNRHACADRPGEPQRKI